MHRIKNRRYLSQIRDFLGLQFGKAMMPTDIDFFFEYRNRCFIFGELKYEKAALPTGQKLALERLSDNLKKPNIVLVCEHDARAEEDIDVSRAILVQYYLRGEWRVPQRVITVRQAMIEYLGTFGLEV